MPLRSLHGRLLGLLVALTSMVASASSCSSSASGWSSAPSVGSFGEGPPVGTDPAVPAPLPGTTGKGYCPLYAPAARMSCVAMTTCEYGEAADPACNVIASCDGGAWTVDAPTHCPTSCPARFDQRVPGTACADPDVCTYLEATCGCAGAKVSGSSGVDGGDGGDAARVGHWECVRPAGACPARRPLLGTACIGASICDYGTCLFGVPLAFQCNGQTWGPAPEPDCP
jgi:hypothetical protein